MTKLLNTDDAIQRLGGPSKVARRLAELSGEKITPQRVNNWRTKERGQFPHWTHPYLEIEFRSAGLEPSLALWGLSDPSEGGLHD